MHGVSLLSLSAYSELYDCEWFYIGSINCTFMLVVISISFNIFVCIFFLWFCCESSNLPFGNPQPTPCPQDHFRLTRSLAMFRRAGGETMKAGAQAGHWHRTSLCGAGTRKKSPLGLAESSEGSVWMGCLWLLSALKFIKWSKHGLLR